MGNGSIRRARQLEVLKKATSSAATLEPALTWSSPHRAPTHNNSRQVKCKERSKKIYTKNYHRQLHSSSELPFSSASGPGGKSDVKLLLQLPQAEAVEVPIPPRCSHLCRCTFPPRASKCLARFILSCPLCLARLVASALLLSLLILSFSLLSSSTTLELGLSTLAAAPSTRESYLLLLLHTPP